MTLTVDAVVPQDDFVLRASTSCQAGRVTVVLGPNGAGKSTLLRVVAGLLPLERGAIVHDGTTWDDPDRNVMVPAERRRVGMVFQDPLLFPHLDVTGNVSFGLRRRGIAKAAARATAEEWLGRVDLADRTGARPSELSGGEQQRVALARALAPAPDVLLLDEPLSALDAAARDDTRRLLRRHLDGFDGVAVAVTHDPVDALLLADDVVVLEEGAVVQQGPLTEVTTAPRSAHVAHLLGVNLLQGVASAGTISLASGGVVRTTSGPDGDVFVLIRPNAVTLQRQEPHSSARNRWELTVTTVEAIGDRARVHLGGAPSLVGEVTVGAVGELGLAPGERVWATVKATEVDVYAV